MNSAARLVVVGVDMANKDGLLLCQLYYLEKSSRALELRFSSQEDAEDVRASKSVASTRG